MKFSALLLTTFLISQPVWAQTPDKTPDASITDRPVYSPILPVHIQPRQAGADSMSKAAADIAQENRVNPDSLGLYTRASEGGLGENIWKNYTGAALADDLSSLNLNFTSPVFQSLLKRALLTTPSAQQFADDKNSDVFSARLRSLMDIGSFDETATLYNRLEGNIPSPKAALAGAEALAGLGQGGVVCLEEKALSPDLKQAQGTSFWPDLNAFCRILLAADTPSAKNDDAALVKSASSFASGKKLLPPAALSELNGKSLIEIIAMTKAGLLPESLFTPGNVKILKPETIALLLRVSTAPATRLSLMTAEAEKGMTEREAFQMAFVAQASQPEGGYWQPYFALYNKARSAAPADKVAALKDILDKSDTSAEAELIPFAPLIAGVKNTGSFTSAQAKKAVSLLIRSKLNVSGVWAAKAFGKDEISSRESVKDTEVLSFLTDSFIPASGKTADDGKNKVKSPDMSKNAKTIDNSHINAISLMLQDEEAEDKVKNKSYEKLLSLTPPNDYVMPSKELLNNLTQASANQDTGKVILYSLQILNGQRISQIHPAALFRISEGLKSVGLSEENKSLAHEALADLIEY